MNPNLGKCYGIGVGPGDPELITLKAKRLIESADIVAYPATQTGESMARQIAAQCIQDSTREYPIKINMSSNASQLDDAYTVAANTISEFLENGKNVAILCEGDPFFYGSFIYIFSKLKTTHRVEVIPGVSSIMACGAVSLQPLTSHNDILKVIPATLDKDKIKRQLDHQGTTAIIKLGRHFQKVKALLNELNLLDCASYIERATLANQKQMPLTDHESDKAPYFSMILVNPNWKQMYE